MAKKLYLVNLVVGEVDDSGYLWLNDYCLPVRAKSTADAVKRVEGQLVGEEYVASKPYAVKFDIRTERATRESDYALGAFQWHWFMNRLGSKKVTRRFKRMERRWVVLNGLDSLKMAIQSKESPALVNKRKRWYRESKVARGMKNFPGLYEFDKRYSPYYREGCGEEE